MSSHAKRQEGGALCSNWALGCLAICRVAPWAGESVQGTAKYIALEITALIKFHCVRHLPVRGEGVGAVPVGWEVVDEVKWNLNSSSLWDRGSLHSTVLHTHSGQPAMYLNLESENLLFYITPARVAGTRHSHRKVASRMKFRNGYC